jgi:hypothetical protein
MSAAVTSTPGPGARAPRRARWVSRLAGPLGALGPYAAIVLMVPGGSLIALTLWAYRNHPRFLAGARRALARLALRGGVQPVLRTGARTRWHRAAVRVGARNSPLPAASECRPRT